MQSISQKKRRAGPVKAQEDKALPKIQILSFKAEDLNQGLLKEKEGLKSQVEKLQVALRDANYNLQKQNMADVL